MKKTFARKRALAVLALLIFLCPARGGRGEEIIVPTCTQDGYALQRHPDGTVTARRYLPATGHSFGEWVFDPANGEGVHTCLICGEEERVSVRQEGLPRLFLTSGRADGRLEAVLSGSEHDFSCLASMTALGQEGFALNLFQPEAGQEPFYQTFSGWAADYRFTLSADWTDPSAVRGLIAADLWRRAAAARTLPERLEMLPLLGGTDGFPVTVWLDGVFDGLYVFSPRDGVGLYGMYQNETSVIASAGSRGADTLFHASASFLEGESGWQIRFYGDADEQQARSRLNQLIRFVLDSDDRAFQSGLSQYLDIDGAVDALLLTWALGLKDGCIPTLLYYGEQWIPTLNGVRNVFAADEGECLPQRTKEGLDSGTGNLLFDRLVSVFPDRIVSRYRALRKTVLNEEQAASLISGRLDSIPQAAWALDGLLHPARTEASEEGARLTDALRERLRLLDAALGGY